jgi:hypothetical protein
MHWSSIAQTNPADAYIIYAGSGGQQRSTGTVLSWQNAGSLITKLEK